MKLAQVSVGMLATNCYLVADDAGRCAVIDPGSGTEKILKAAEEHGFQIEAILLTHGHFDHVMAAPGVQRATDAKLYIHKNDEPDLAPEVAGHRGYLREPYVMPRVDGYLEEGQILKLGSLDIKVLHTPGHTAGCCTFLCGDAMFSGDTLFQECCGRTDLETGSLEEILKSLKRLAQLEGNFRVLPGHEGFSSLDYERQYNPYIREAMKR